MRPKRLLALLPLLVLLAGCGGGVTVSTDYDQTADFSNWKTYRWAERSETGRKDPRVYNDLLERRIQEAVDATLQEKGYRKITEGTPDFYAAWHGAIETKVDVTTVYDDYRYNWGYWDPLYYRPTAQSTYVNEYDQGTLILDLIDADGGEEGKPVLVWRSTLSKVVDSRNVGRDPEKMRKAAEALLNGFPPR
jgi:hypothetical protein